MNGGPVNSSKTVYYFNRVAHPIYLELVAAEPDIELHKLVNDSPDGDVAPVMAAAHAYQIDSTRAAIPEKYWASEALLARNPNLLLVSTNGAGYDTVDVAACTRAGILVVNQSGANREAVAEHALGPLGPARVRHLGVDVGPEAVLRRPDLLQKVLGRSSVKWKRTMPLVDLKPYFHGTARRRGAPFCLGMGLP